MKDSIVNVGVVGTSWWADAMYLPALQNHPHARVAAVVGRDTERTQDFAQRWNIPKAYTDYADMLARESLDAVIILAPNNQHFPMTMQALDRKLHVLCEKPLGMNYAETVQMTDAADKAGVKTMVPFTYSFMPALRYIASLVDDGYLGQLYHLNMRYFAGYARDGQYMWRFDLDEAGAGVAGDLGTHWMYLASWLFGDVKAVTALLSSNVKRAPKPDGSDYPIGEDAAIILLEFANGAQGVLHMSAVAYEATPFGQIHEMEFHGSAGTLHLRTDWDTLQQVLGTRAGEGMVKPLEIPDSIWNGARRDTVHNTYKDVFRTQDFMTRGFISAIVDHTSPSPTFADGMKVQRMLDAAMLSGKTHRRVLIEEITA
ncbi:MAG TPA: Gfo/Idh/MocA family oxidoreductase [Phototrophicaceae bacterium]|nr:Gfo/Idh/MocA family oxidoreductase [Phototrophicaceae bacterium]